MADLGRPPEGRNDGSILNRSGKPARLRVTIEGERGAGKTLLAHLIVRAFNDGDSITAQRLREVNEGRVIVIEEKTVG